MSEKDIVVNALLELNDIAQSFSQRLSGVRKDFQKALQKQNEELELQNEAQALVGHNKELQQNIIYLMKEYGLSSSEALKLIDDMSKTKTKLKVFANATENIRGDISDVMQSVYTSGEEQESAEIDYSSLKAHVRYKVASPEYKEAFMKVIDEHEMVGGFLQALQEKEIPLGEVFEMIDVYEKNRDKKEFTSGEDPGDTHEPKEVKGITGSKIHDELLTMFREVYNGDFPMVLDKETYKELIKIIKEHQAQNEPSKGSGTPNYGRILDQLDWALDCKESVSHYRLYNEIKSILKEHQEQNKPVEYYRTTNIDSLSKDFKELFDKNSIKSITQFKDLYIGYKGEKFCVEGCDMKFKEKDGILIDSAVKPVETGVYDENNKPDTVPLETKKDLTETKEHKELMERSINPVNQREYIVPLTPSIYADGPKPKPEIDTTHEGRIYQEMTYKDYVITFLEGDKVIKSTDIHEALQYVYLLCEGYMAHIDKRRYRMKEIHLKSFPSHEVIVKVEEVKRYE